MKKTKLEVLNGCLFELLYRRDFDYPAAVGIASRYSILPTQPHVSYDDCRAGSLGRVSRREAHALFLVAVVYLSSPFLAAAAAAAIELGLFFPHGGRMPRGGESVVVRST